MRKKCLYSELFWSVFSRIRTDYGEKRSIPSSSVQLRENMGQNNSQYGYFLRSVNLGFFTLQIFDIRLEFTFSIQTHCFHGLNLLQFRLGHFRVAQLILKVLISFLDAIFSYYETTEFAHLSNQSSH